MKFLAIDDDMTSLMKLELMLEDHGETTCAVDTDKGLELIDVAYEKKEPYQAVFLDIVFPEGIDGIEVLKQIRSMERQHIGTKSRVFMVSAKKDLGTMLDSYKNLCDGFISKPYGKDHIDRLFKKHFDI